VRRCFFVDEDGGATDVQEYCYDGSVHGVHPVIATKISNNEDGMSYSDDFFCFFTFVIVFSPFCFDF
jgi:hypothetical protein